MAHKTCPQCQTTLVTGFWEVFENCPSCGAVWSTDPELKANMASKLALVTVACALLAAVPVAGFFVGAAAIGLGLVTMSKGRRTVGIMSIVLGSVFGIVGQPLFVYWAIGRLPERSCGAAMQTVSDSVRSYRALMHKYPAKLSDLTDAKLKTPEACPSVGGKFFYVSPDSLAAAAAPAVAETAKSIERGNSRTLIAAEVYQAHRAHRTCMTSDLKVLSLTEDKFNAMLAQPENNVFAVKLDEAYRAATQPAEKTPFRIWLPQRAGQAFGPATQPIGGETVPQLWTAQHALEAMPAALAPTAEPAQ